MRKFLAFAILVGATCFAFVIAREVWRLYGSAGADVQLGVITAAGSALAFVANNAVQSARERKARLFENKREAYDKFFEFFFSIFTSQKSGNPLGENELAEKFQEFTRAVMTWGSADTINSVIEFQRASNGGDPNDLKKMLAPTETLLRALRKDLGHSDSAMDRYGLTKLILKADEHHKLD